VRNTTAILHGGEMKNDLLLELRSKAVKVEILEHILITLQALYWEIFIEVERN